MSVEGDFLIRGGGWLEFGRGCGLVFYRVLGKWMEFRWWLRWGSVEWLGYIFLDIGVFSFYKDFCG